MSKEDDLRKLFGPISTISSAKSVDELIRGSARFGIDSLQDSATSALNKHKAFIEDLVKPSAFSAFSAAALLDSSALPNSIIGHSAASFASQIDFEKLSLGSSKNISEIFKSHISLPTPTALQVMFDTLEAQIAKTNAEIITESWVNRFADIEKSISSMQQPWLDLNNAGESFTAFAELQNIGQSLRYQDPFGDAVTNQLREDFGDWRNKIEYDSTKILNPTTRASLYFDQGLNKALTSFTDSSFYEATWRAGLREYSEIIDVGEVREIKIESEEEDVPSQERLETALLYVSRFENHMRRFIQQHMLEAFGDKWIVQNVSVDIRSKWSASQNQARERGQRIAPLFEYSNFTEYKEIIINSRNWKVVFHKFFYSKESITESLQRMYPLRNSAMHSRWFTKEDELLLLTETYRILKAIGVNTTLSGELRLILPR